MGTRGSGQEIASALELLEGIAIERAIKTPFSWLFFSGSRVYKIRHFQQTLVPSTSKDPGDFTRLEFDRGRRFADDIYLDVISVEHNGGVVPVLVSRRLRDEDLLTGLLPLGLTRRKQGALIDGLNELHLRSTAIASGSAVESIEFAFRLIRRIVRQRRLDRLAEAADKILHGLRGFVAKNRELLESRLRHGSVLDTHGDLHSSNIFVSASAVFIDPAVAAPSMYRIDYLQQLADVFVDIQASGSNLLTAVKASVQLAVSDEDAEYLLNGLFLPLRALTRLVIHDLYESVGLRSPLAAPASRYLLIAHGRID